MQAWSLSNRGAVILHALLVLTIAWGALAFGAVYAWAYWPLAIACAICGASAVIATAGANVPGVSRGLVTALVVVAAAIGLQLVPLPARVLSAISPSMAPLTGRLSPAFAAGLQPTHAVSVWPRDTAVALILYASFALLCSGLVSLFNMTGARRFVEWLTGFGALLAIIGFAQKSFSSRYLYGFWELEAGRTPFGPFVNRNHFAGWMVMALPLTLGLLVAGIDHGVRVRRGWHHRLLWFASPEANRLMLAALAAVLMALSLMLTMSRSGITAFGLSMIVTGWFVSQSVRSRSRRIVATTCLVLLVATVIVWSGPEVVASRFAAADWGEFNNRKGAWLDAWSVARAFPLVGTGVNTYWAAALFYQQHDMSYFFGQAHNDYLQLAAEGGLLVTVPAIACLLVFVRDVRRSLYQSRGEASWWLRAGAVASVIAMAFQETVDFSLQMPGNAALFAAVCAVALHTGPPKSQADENTADAPSEVPRSRSLRIVEPPRVRQDWSNAPDHP
jgi:O-antigen ligase